MAIGVPSILRPGTNLQAHTEKLKRVIGLAKLLGHTGSQFVSEIDMLGCSPREIEGVLQAVVRCLMPA